MSARHAAEGRRGNVTENSGKNNGRIQNLKPWKPGESGNPGGRPKRTPLTDAYRELMSQIIEGDPKKRTYAQAIAERIARQAISDGNLHAAIEIADRVEGKSITRSELAGAGGEDLFSRLSREENELRIAKLLAGAVE